MGDSGVVDAATKRLQKALEALESALERRLEVDRDRGVLSDHIHSLGVDRSRLASDLDEAIARARRLETANREVAQRLDTAMTTIKSVIDSNTFERPVTTESNELDQ
jgi:hypothetical protein